MYNFAVHYILFSQFCQAPPAAKDKQHPNRQAKKSDRDADLRLQMRGP